MSISGIGEKLALRIIEYRDRNGGFDSLEELKEVKGITGLRFSKISGCLSVE
jgi:competence ComEA-like helix-hairpin-helix protein